MEGIKVKKYQKEYRLRKYDSKYIDGIKFKK